jgi:predicted acylesterase/phospholipase RssA
MPEAPTRKCDIVMKGGITSGIVYPGVVCKLAESYRFDSIGGTSAGAIAATLTAAAEYARARNPAAGNPFDVVGKVPGWLAEDSPSGGGSNLFQLFQPQPGMRTLFRFATGFLTHPWLRRIGVWARALWLELLLGFVPGAVLMVLGRDRTGWEFWLSEALGFLVGLAGALVTAAAGLVLRACRLPSHRYGLCTGYASPRPGAPPTLIQWLNERLNTIAGKAPDQPLTFGDLENAGITLRMISTCLTFGRPFTLPFETADFLFDPDEMRLYFPEEVVAWMEAHSLEFQTHEKVDLGRLRPLPARQDLPVIFTARMSLSFPVLFCAVPLYAIDWTRRRLETDPGPRKRVPGDALGPDESRVPEPVWFSDGGITSNFPIHLFDAPVPRWPTFGIDLGDLRADRDADESRAWMPTTNAGGIANQWTRLPVDPGLAGAGGFGGAMFDAARNWMDNLQATVPGYRDRVVHIFLSKTEGGLNLNMPKNVVTALAGYGVQAGEKLIDRFVLGQDCGGPTPMTWDNQRWVRFRSTMAAVEHFVTDFSYGVQNPEPGDSTYADLLRRGRDEPPDSYRLKNDDQRDYAEELMDHLKDLGDQAAVGTMQEGAPRPKPDLRIRPKF